VKEVQAEEGGRGGGNFVHLFPTNFACKEEEENEICPWRIRTCYAELRTVTRQMLNVTGEGRDRKKICVRRDLALHSRRGGGEG